MLPGILSASIQGEEEQSRGGTQLIVVVVSVSGVQM